MPTDSDDLTQRAIARDVMAWCQSEGMSISRQLQRALATRVRPAATVIQLDLEDTIVAIHVDRIEIRMPHRTAEWAYAPADVPGVVAAITRLLETG